MVLLEQDNELGLDDGLPVELEPLGKLVSLLKLPLFHEVLEAVNRNGLGEGFHKDLQATGGKQEKQTTETKNKHK